MRKILFRGFHEDDNGAQKGYYNGEQHNGYWVEGSLFYDPDLGHYEICGFDYYVSENGYEREAFNYLVAPKTVGQYIGLTDMNGNKIFEGDLVKDTADNDVLLAVEGSTPFGFDFRYISDDEDDAYVTAFDIGIDDDMKYLTSAVITGKIYDNPEMLQEKETCRD